MAKLRAAGLGSLEKGICRFMSTASADGMSFNKNSGAFGGDVRASSCTLAEAAVDLRGRKYAATLTAVAITLHVAMIRT